MEDSDSMDDFNRTTYTRTQIRPMIAQYDPKRGTKTELSDLVMTQYKCEKNDVPVTLANGSTLPLVEFASTKDLEANAYNPFENRNVKRPVSNMAAFTHLLKGSLGSGILAMPFAFAHAGLGFGLFATLAIGLICTYCVHVLVKCSHELCRRIRVPSLDYDKVAETAFLAGPPGARKYSRLARATINLFLAVDLLGCCCCYIVFVASNIKTVVDVNTGTDHDLRMYMLALLLPLILMNLIRNLKYLAPLSTVANILMFVGISITTYYLVTDLPPIDTAPPVANVKSWPIFFGTVIFALEGIGVVLPLENEMKTPKSFLGCPGVLNMGMAIVVSVYAFVGFFGFWRFGSKTNPNIIVNLDVNGNLIAQAVNIMIAIAIFFTYSLQFYVPMKIIWTNVREYFTKHETLAEYSIRVFLVFGTTMVAIAIPNLGPFISLVGAVCLSTLGLMFPAIIELVTVYERPGFGRYNWILWKNLLLIAFGVVGFVTGSWVSIQDILTELNKTK